MTTTKAKGGRVSPLSLLIWVILAIALATAAYLLGAQMAQQWAIPPLTSPLPTPASDQTPQQVATAAAWLNPDSPVEGTLEAEGGEEWQFQARAGQSAIIEMWLHPGSGSGIEAELAAHLIAPDDTVLASETGSVFLVPYLVVPRLPVDGLYRVQVAPVSGVPGRYSLALTLSDGSAPSLAGVPGTPQPTDGAPGESVATATQGMFMWPTTRREISGWIFHDPGNPGHIGLDIAARMWDPLVAVADGVVAFAEWGGGYGNLVIVDHQDGWVSYYAHLTEITVNVGQQVRQGELLGGAGTTGYSTGPHLHFELRYKGRPVDPHLHLP